VKFGVTAAEQLVLVGVHTDPDDAVSEMEALVDVHAAVQRHWNTDNILILGDLNADCSYASGRARKRLRLRTDQRFSWLIDDDVDTTTTNSHCAYDRCALCNVNKNCKFSKALFVCLATFHALQHLMLSAYRLL